VFSNNLTTQVYWNRFHYCDAVWWATNYVASSTSKECKKMVCGVTA